jgi:hypothetical protein
VWLFSFAAAQMLTEHGGDVGKATLEARLSRYNLGPAPRVLPLVLAFALARGLRAGGAAWASPVAAAEDVASEDVVTVALWAATAAVWLLSLLPPREKGMTCGVVASPVASLSRAVFATASHSTRWVHLVIYIHIFSVFFFF